jgi:hypothetical protein
MFTPEEVDERLHQRPFAPFRIVTSAGPTFDVFHPDLVLVGRRSLIIGTASSENPRHYELTTRVAMMHITDLEDLPAPAPSQGNGS